MNEIKILAFDVFGTVVDWHTTVVREIGKLDPAIDGDAFALAWREGYQPALQRVLSGKLDWTLLDDLHRMILDDILKRFDCVSLTENEKQHLNRVWHRLDPWPDSVEGLTRLKAKYTVCSLSNGNLELLADMARHAGLPWDRILSAETFRKYKPHPDTYLGVARIFAVSPGEVMMVAAHHDDLAGARACGLQTAFIDRPAEFGPARSRDISPGPENTLHAKDILHLAAMLGC